MREKKTKGVKVSQGEEFTQQLQQREGKNQFPNHEVLVIFFESPVFGFSASVPTSSVSRSSINVGGGREGRCA